MYTNILATRIKTYLIVYPCTGSVHPNPHGALRSAYDASAGVERIPTRENSLMTLNLIETNENKQK
jgi:hypothetical protein